MKCGYELNQWGSICSKWTGDALDWSWRRIAANVAVTELISGGERQPETVGQNCRTGQIDKPVGQA